MGSNVLVAFLETVVLGDVVEVILSDNDSAVHFGGRNYTLDDSSTDGNIAGEGALLINVLALDGGSGGLESQANVLVVASLITLLLSKELAGSLLDGGLLLESSLSLST